MSESLWNRVAHICAAKGRAPAIFQDARTTSFADLARAANGVAAALKTVAAGDRVLVCGENDAAFLAVVAGIWKRGAIPVLVHADAPFAHLEQAVAVTLPTAAFADVDSPLAQLLHCRPIEMPKAEVPAITPTLGPEGPQPGSIVFTSGSSGPPKGVTQSAENLLSGSTRVAEALNYRQTDRILCPIPFAFDYGWGQALSVLFQGIPLVLPSPRNAFGVCNALEQHKPTVFAAIPAVVADLSSGLAPISDTPRGSVRLITNTGSRIAAPVFERIRDLFPQAAFSLNYGLTETYRSACLPVDEANSFPTSVGYALAGVRIDVLRADGTAAAPLEQGEIVHSGAGTFLGYWNDPERTASVLHAHPLTGDPAVFTGDLGHKDTAGRLYIHGRRDRQLKSMGVRVAPDEIEALLMESGLLKTAAISFLPHDMIGDMIVACVVPQDGNTTVKDITKALRIFARKNMSAHMQPRKYLVLGALPETRSAKTDYHTLAELVRASA